MGYLSEKQTNFTIERKMKILFFTETLFFGGKERRLLELIYFLKKTTKHEIVLALTEDQIHYKYVYELDIPIVIIKRKWTKYDPIPFIRFYKFCREFKPDIIHSWGRLTTFYSIPSKILGRIPLVSSMIADSNRGYGPFTLKYFSLKADILFANIILSNSRAGLKAYGIDIVDGPLAGVYGRSVVVVDETGKVKYTELVPEITQEPNYDAALAAL